MYLKRVDMENFKSFGGKISIPLMEGYMAITGPNGSGKSNITDAILFVLGPKSSKAMRAGKLTDLINKSNRDRKADYTKVTLYFDNTDRLLPWDSDEVRFTRMVKLAADGENYSSTFYINDQKSTMAEFDSLLTRARISADGYNMVQQGDVTDITKMGNMDRRRIIDSISGISSYDADISRAETEKEEAQKNMADIKIIVDELEKRLGELEKDKESAKKYLETKDRLDMSKAQLTKRQLSNKEDEYKYVSDNIQKIQGEIDGLIAKRDAFNADIARIEVEIKAKEDEIAAKVGPEYEDIKKKIEDVKFKKAIAEDTVSRTEDEKASDTSALESELEELKEAETSLTDAVNAVNDIRMKIAAKEDELRDAKAESERISQTMRDTGGELRTLEERLSALEKDIDAKAEKEIELSKSKNAAELAEEEASRAIASIENSISDIGFEIKDAEWNIQNVKKEAGPEADVKTFTDRIFALKSQESELEKQERELNDSVRRISQEYNALAAEKKVSDRMRGSDAVVAVLEMRDKGVLKGIHGTVAELASVDKEYETALSVAAGGKMQAIIVDSDEVAAAAIAELKKTGHGRATFLPLNKMMEGKPRAKAIMVVKQTLGYAIDLIEFKEEYRAAFWYVFADTLVVDNINDGRRLMGGVRLVTKSGELFEASGAMTGGTIRTQTLKFGAASESKLDEVSAKLRAANDSLDHVRSKLIEIRNSIRTADDDMRKAGAGNIELQGKLAKLEGSLRELRESKKRYGAQLDEKKKDYESAKGMTQKASGELQKVSGELAALRDEKIKIRERIGQIAPADLQQRIQDARDLEYRLTNERTALVDSLGSFNAEKSEHENTIRFLKKDIGDIRENLSKADQTIAEQSKKAAELKISLDALRSIESDMERGIEGLKDEKDALVEGKYKAINGRDIAVNDLDVKNGIKSSTEASLNDISAQITELRVQDAAITIAVEEPIPAEETIKRTIRSCEASIQSLGTVNLRALEEYGTVKDRYDTLTSNVDRLNEQIKDLTDLSNSLGKKKKGLFMEVYDGVNANFKTIFAELSGGGEASMSLENEDDPFKGGLIINAKPKNGKMLTLDLLSGGEKSLTALAFIFAIQEYQPSPFYVLDEVDMFLDSVNSEMVAKRVKKGSAKTQFIQVSLRKVTLTLADHLIGVTRPPNGVSKVIMQPNLAEVSKYEEDALRNINDKKEGIE